MAPATSSLSRSLCDCRNLAKDKASAVQTFNVRVNSCKAKAAALQTQKLNTRGCALHVLGDIASKATDTIEGSISQGVVCRQSAEANVTGLW